MADILTGRLPVTSIDYPQRAGHPEKFTGILLTVTRHHHDTMQRESSPEQIGKTLAHTPLFQALSQEQLEHISRSIQEIRLSKGEVLFRAGETPTGFYIVAYGQIKLMITSSSGDEKVVEIIGPRQSFGEAVMFLQRPYPVTAVALIDTWLLKAPQTAVDEVLANDPLFAKRMLAGLSFRLHSLIQDVESYSMRSSTQRVIGFLLQHIPEDSPETQEITLPTTKLVIASRLNLTPETLSRILNELSQHRLIEVHGRQIKIISQQGLRAYLG